MANKTWEAVDSYFLGKIIGQDAALEQTQRDAEAAGLPPISVTAPHGKLLQLLVKIHGARRVLEVGTLAGYSTIWMARALPPAFSDKNSSQAARVIFDIGDFSFENVASPNLVRTDDRNGGCRGLGDLDADRSRRHGGQ